MDVLVVFFLLLLLLKSNFELFIRILVLGVEQPTYWFLLVMLYLGGVTAFGLVVSRKGKDKNASDYFLGSRTIGSFVLGSSLFVTGIASMWLLGSVGTTPLTSSLGVWYGILVAAFILVLGYWASPLYLKSKVCTVPEFVSFRFNNATALSLSGFSILFYVGVKIPLALTIASWMFEHALGWGSMTSIGLMVVVMLIGLYTISGGFTSVVRTQMVQAMIVLGGSVAVAVSMMMDPITSIGRSGASLFVEPDGWLLPFLIGMPIVLVWHWCADQYVVQRVLAARDLKTVRRGSLIGAGLVLIEIILFVVIISLASLEVPAMESSSLTVLWAKGIGTVAFLALLMATLSSDFHSTATLFALDFYRGAYPDASDETLVLVGRLSTSMIVILAILAVSTVSLVDPRLIALLQQVQIYFAPPIVAVFVLGVFWRRASSKGALWALLCGESFGAIALIARFFSDASALNGMFMNLNLYLFSVVSLLASALILVAVSFLTEAPPLETTTYMSILRRKQS